MSRYTGMTGTEIYDAALTLGTGLAQESGLTGPGHPEALAHLAGTVWALELQAQNDRDRIDSLERRVERLHRVIERPTEAPE